MSNKTGGEGPEAPGHKGVNDDEATHLIERYFPSKTVSKRGRAERYQRGKTPHTIFTWWARRPFAAARAVVTTSLIRTHCADESTRELVEQYCGGEDAKMIRMALQSVAEPGEKRVLDMFGGGGTIPLEAARMGADVCTVENNQLAHFIQKSLLELSQVGPRLARDVRRAGQRLLEELQEETREFFPARNAGSSGRTIAYLWTTEMQCSGCSSWLSLMRRPWLSKRSDRHWYVRRQPRPRRGDYSVEIRRDGEPDDDQSAWDGNEILCPFCDHRIDREEIRETMKRHTRSRMVAVCTSQGRHTKTRKEFRVAEERLDFPKRSTLMTAMIRDLTTMGEQLPDASLPRWSGVTNPALYGFENHVDLFNLRQRAVLVRLCRLLGEHHDRLKERFDDRRAAAITVYLSGFIDQLVDWNSRLSTWISQNEQVGRALSGPGMAMVWDHVEIDPVEEAPANLWDKLERIVSGIRAIPKFQGDIRVIQGDARDLPFDDDSFDVVATDPPYFDNIFYSVLADCLYVWKRLALGGIFPDMFAEPTTDQDRELTMNPHLRGDAGEAARHYTEGMQQVLGEARRVVADDGVVSLVFAHSTVAGWTSIVDALLGARLKLVAAWPMYVERKQRPRGMSARAVNTSFVLVAKHRNEQRKKIELDDFVARIQDSLKFEDEQLESLGEFGSQTRGRTLFGLGIAFYTKIGRVFDERRELNSREVVESIADVVESIVDGWRIERG